MSHSLLEEHIFQLERRLMSRGYTDLDDLLADDFLEFGSSGNSYDKKIQLERSESNTSVQFAVTDFEIKCLATDVVLATYRTYKHNDGTRALRSSIWKFKEGKWQMVFHQGTPVALWE